MIFSTYSFWIFFIVTLGIINFAPAFKINIDNALPMLSKLVGRTCSVRRVLLIGASIYFLIKFSGNLSVYPIFMLGFLSYLMPFVARKYHRRWLLMLPIILCVMTLMYYKYLNLLGESLLTLTSGNMHAAVTAVYTLVVIHPAPLAISFFTFEFCHYLIDVYRGRPMIRKVDEFLAFALFFPTLVAGPIKRYVHFINELRKSPLTLSFESSVVPFIRIIVGLAKKLFIADPVTSLINDMYGAGTLPGIYGSGGMHGYTTVFFILLLYVRIYVDFSAYSDIAIGCAKIFGIKIPENFNFPFLANSLSDFWQRWHISLSAWIRDYLYIPLGGGRSSIKRKLFNICLIMLVAGLWHGAAWNYACWGILHGVGLVVQHSYFRLLPEGKKLSPKCFPFLGILLTFTFVSFSWLIFFYSPAEALRIIITLRSGW